MYSRTALCLLLGLMALVAARPNESSSQQNNEKLKPMEWLSSAELRSAPSVNDISWERLESVPVEEGAKMIEQIYHLSQINYDLRPNFVPSASNVPVTIYRPNGQKVQARLNNFVTKAKQQPEFGDDEVTIFITGLPQNTETIKKATRKLEQAYMQRYNLQEQQQKRYQPQNNDDKNPSSSEEAEDEWKKASSQSGSLVVIDLGSTLTNFKRYAMLDIEQTGQMIGQVLVKLTDEANVPQEILHIVAQGMASHVAGAAAKEYTASTGHKLRRITALDPSKIYAKYPGTLVGLARGDAEFVDAIHTSSYGLGVPQRMGDIDFYPNGVSAGVPGAENVIEASMRATRYFAESVRPGNERNFPAVAAASMKQYQNNDGFGKRTYMGIKADYDLEGDYMLQVNANSPFGQRSKAQKQSTYHGVH